MAFCIHCGAKLDGAEKFCPNCGEQVLQSHQSDSEQTSRRARNGSSNNENLAAAVASTKQRSRRKTPLILLIAFALAAVAGTAYAAYTIISKITAPENTQQAQDSAQSLEEAETYVADTKEAAIEAYAKVIADYDSVAGLKESDVDLSEHPYLNPENPIESSYAYFDLSDDGIPELLIGLSTPSDIGEYGGVFDIWTYQNGELVRVMASESARHGYIQIRKDGMMVNCHNLRSSFTNGNGEGEVDLWQLQPLSEENVTQDISSRVSFAKKVAWTQSGSDNAQGQVGKISELRYWENGSWTELSPDGDYSKELRTELGGIFNTYKEEDAIEWHDFEKGQAAQIKRRQTKQ